MLQFWVPLGGLLSGRSWRQPVLHNPQGPCAWTKEGRVENDVQLFDKMVFVEVGSVENIVLTLGKRGVFRAHSECDNGIFSQSTVDVYNFGWNTGRVFAFNVTLEVSFLHQNQLKTGVHKIPFGKLGFFANVLLYLFFCELWQGETFSFVL